MICWRYNAFFLGESNRLSTEEDSLPVLRCSLQKSEASILSIYDTTDHVRLFIIESSETTISATYATPTLVYHLNEKFGLPRQTLIQVNMASTMYDLFGAQQKVILIHWKGEVAL